MSPRFAGGMGGPPPMMGGRPPRPPRHKDEGQRVFGAPTSTKNADDFYEEKFDFAQMEKECEHMLELHFLTKENAYFSKDVGNFLNLTVTNKVDGQTDAANHSASNTAAFQYKQVDIVRTFPFHAPDCFLSVRQSTGKNQEIGMIENLQQDFDKETVSLIQEFLSMRYYMPTIKKIHQLKEEGGYIHLSVVTDRGKAEFSLQSNGSHITFLSDARLLITDLEGGRYEIPDLSKLSAKERKKIDILL